MVKNNVMRKLCGAFVRSMHGEKSSRRLSHRWILADKIIINNNYAP